MQTLGRVVGPTLCVVLGAGCHRVIDGVPPAVVAGDARAASTVLLKRMVALRPDSGPNLTSQALSYRLCFMPDLHGYPQADRSFQACARQLGIPLSSSCGQHFWFIAVLGAHWVSPDEVVFDADLAQFHEDDIDILIESWVEGTFVVKRSSGDWSIVSETLFDPSDPGDNAARRERWKRLRPE